MTVEDELQTDSYKVLNIVDFYEVLCRISILLYYKNGGSVKSNKASDNAGDSNGDLDAGMDDGGDGDVLSPTSKGRENTCVVIVLRYFRMFLCSRLLMQSIIQNNFLVFLHPKTVTLCILLVLLLLLYSSRKLSI